eukprot:UN22582
MMTICFPFCHFEVPLQQLIMGIFWLVLRLLEMAFVLMSLCGPHQRKIQLIFNISLRFTVDLLLIHLCYRWEVENI